MSGPLDLDRVLDAWGLPRPRAIAPTAGGYQNTTCYVSCASRGGLMRAALLAALLAAACAAPPDPTGRSAGPPESFVIPTQLANGRVELTIRHAYTLGNAVTIPVTIAASRGSITGPTSARVLASGIPEGSAPAEVVVRSLSTSTLTVAAGQRRATTLSWDGRDEHGELVPADAYSLVLDFRLEDGAAVTAGRAGATLQLNAP